MIWHLNIRGVCPFRCSCVRLWIFGRYNIPIRVDLDIGHCLGDPRTVSCNVDCCKTLSRIARILKTMGRWGLFHGISKEPRVLLRKVRSCDLNVVIFLAQVHTSFIAVSSLELSNFSPNLYVCMPPTYYQWYLHLTGPHHVNRTQLPWQRGSILALFNFLASFRCLYWDHTSSLDFENIMLISSPTPTKELPWLQWISRSACTFQLVVCSPGNIFID
jgi:hypothetical protein